MSVAAHYLWWIVALVLIAIEVIMPGYFMLWIGIGAAATGLLVLLLPGLSMLVQAIVFVVLAFVSCAVYWYAVRPALQKGEQDDGRLNRRGEQLIGRRYVLIEAIVNGRGKAKVGDGQWLVSGPDLPAGSTVEVVAVEGATLKVRPA
ncbi:NfeD family protein [Dyella nitratireducens]|uniref:Membrane protein n=1 Tax=Dyella nitratireducens TaxID=1849580 RepID=A0ABQ1FPR2_9GAMM|nr:NfeD family protein [Dyella nitratireducens]GGA22557.1 membrane protein [Dyella nitratireducens]GLQ44094.1 membrane protein [Dyella nitratireducens]